MRWFGGAVLVGVVGCGVFGEGDGSGSGGSSGAGTTTAGVGATEAVVPTTGSGEVGSSGATSAGDATSAGSEGGEDGDSPFVCGPTENILGFHYLRTIDIGLSNIQASYFNPDMGEMVFLAWTGQGKRVAYDGTVLGDVMAPAEATWTLDGATYDLADKRALLVDQLCHFVEADPVTLGLIEFTNLGGMFGLNVCSGLAIGLDGHVYITSTLSEEVVVLTRDLTTEVRRFRVDDDGLDNVDGISLIAGSRNFLVLSTYDRKAAIFDPKGEVIVPAAEIGGDAPPLVGLGGGTAETPDAVLTVCGNGHAWLCEGLDKYGCYEFAPDPGEGNSCPCALQQ